MPGLLVGDGSEGRKEVGVVRRFLAGRRVVRMHAANGVQIATAARSLEHAALVVVWTVVAPGTAG
jgi:hypothetical protein